ncbi:hypothetical protein, partial [Marinobacter sp. CH_WH8012-3]|uniref:hypothetical protein n=1 Tax=Marinobacter sp. CH_WH8012-3 TaxID=3107765 RepID=UPI0030092349
MQQVPGLSESSGVTDGIDRHIVLIVVLMVAGPQLAQLTLKREQLISQGIRLKNTIQLLGIFPLVGGLSDYSALLISPSLALHFAKKNLAPHIK